MYKLCINLYMVLSTHMCNNIVPTTVKLEWFGSDTYLVARSTILEFITKSYSVR